MKKIESNSLAESFGLSEMSQEEIYSTNGGFSINIPECKNLGPIIPPLSGMIIGPTKPIDIEPIDIGIIIDKPGKPIYIRPVEPEPPREIM